MIPLRDYNPSSSRPVVTVLVILACVATFLYMTFGLDSQAAQDRFVLTYGATPAVLATSGGLVAAPTLVTSLFLHGGWLHLLGNMLYLWIFGDNVEDRMGHSGFLVFYLLVGVIAAVAHVIVNPVSRIPLIGASGAIAGVLGAYLMLFPRARVRTLAFFGLYFTTISVPAIVMLPLWFLFQFFAGLGSLGTASGAGVAWWAHVGGFLAGVVLVFVFARRGR